MRPSTARRTHVYDSDIGVFNTVDDQTSLCVSRVSVVYYYYYGISSTPTSTPTSTYKEKDGHQSSSVDAATLQIWTLE